MHYKHALYSTEEGDQALVKVVQKQIKELFSSTDPIIKQKLIDLGATPTHFALINAHKEELTKIATENRATDICTLSKQFRFLKIAEDLNKDFNFYDIMLHIGDTTIDLPSFLHQQAFYYAKEADQRRAVISINDAGKKTWDYNDVALVNQGLKPHADIFISLGDGHQPILPESISNLFNTHTRSNDLT